MSGLRDRDSVTRHPRAAGGTTGHAPSSARRERDTRGPVGELVRFEGEEYYRISCYDALEPFLMTLASDTDLWMFVTSGGGLTAGRVDPDCSIFPYETVDRLHDAHHHTGPVTLVRASLDGRKPVLWTPFADPHSAADGVERNLYKTPLGHRLVFEEVNHELGLAFRYRWAASDEFGWVRTATLESLVAFPVGVELLDGVRNVLPWGVSQALQQRTSNLADAYKRSEADPELGLATFSLTAGISDRPEALEMLRATTVWVHGLPEARVHLSDRAVELFRDGRTPPEETRLNGRRGNLLVTSSFELPPGDSRRWHVVADAGRSQADVARLVERLGQGNGIDGDIESSLRSAGATLLRYVAAADGLQMTGHDEVTAHHLANVLFNIMRGGVFDENHVVPTRDLASFIGMRNRAVLERRGAFFDGLPAKLGVRELLRRARESGDSDLERLCLEYLPIHFGRRHGDPSRPWNRFSIHVRNTDGSRALRYEGNWRDIFQNWEALCASFPGFLPSVIAKFVNASTVDGFNPYRVTREGVEWEVPEDGNPWSHIGYWGDHQIIYLLKLLEALRRSSPGELTALLDRKVFSYADVPYRLRAYRDILRNPRETIDYDGEYDAVIERRVRAEGTDGKLVHDADGRVVHVTLLEKLLVPMLSKLSNFVPGGGIWMNTQRPEWNDANNALVGGGVSVATLCYLRRYVAFLDGLLETADRAFRVSSEVADWLRNVGEIIEREAAARLTRGDGERARDRKLVMDALGTAFTRYRETVVSRGLSGSAAVTADEVRRVCWAALEVIDASISANRRDDGLYSAYLLLDISADATEAALRPLDEMLEGQVAVLSSGVPDAGEAADIVERLFESDLYREDQRSFLLYPERRLPGFMERNIVPPDRVHGIPLLERLLERGDDAIILRDASGAYRFNACLQNEDALAAALDRLDEEAADDREAVLALYEDVFDHCSYTGRSGAMYAYEGLGSIYWHMVAKLLLSIQEVYARSLDTSGPGGDTAKLAELYERVRAGLGFEKTPSEYGAFPTDAYSHTPSGGGAKQPGMTGQVKEEILTRWGELGVGVEDGVVSFRPSLLLSGEFLERAGTFEYFDVNGERRAVGLDEGSLAFTYCAVPVVYRRVAGEPHICVLLDDGEEASFDGDSLGRELSRELLERTGRVAEVHVDVPVAQRR
jgi:hypothetical protein